MKYHKISSRRGKKVISGEKKKKSKRKKEKKEKKRKNGSESQEVSCYINCAKLWFPGVKFYGFYSQ